MGAAVAGGGPVLQHELRTPRDERHGAEAAAGQRLPAGAVEDRQHRGGELERVGQPWRRLQVRVAAAACGARAAGPAVAAAADFSAACSYRLCPAAEPLTEACFQKHPLDFVQDKQQLVFKASDVLVCNFLLQTLLLCSSQFCRTALASRCRLPSSSPRAPRPPAPPGRACRSPAAATATAAPATSPTTTTATIRRTSAAAARWASRPAAAAPPATAAPAPACPARRLLAPTARVATTLRATRRTQVNPRPLLVEKTDHCR